MQRNLFFTSIAAIIFALGCGEHAHDEAHDHSPSEEVHDHAHDGAHDHATHEHEGHAHEEDGSNVGLDAGKRWVANKETTAGIAKMRSLLDSYEASSSDPKALKASLEEEFGLIFERCTMTGEAHNQLHNYLIPIHQRLSGFDASDPQALTEMKEYLGKYGDYFE